MISMKITQVTKPRALRNDNSSVVMELSLKLQFFSFPSSITNVKNAKFVKPISLFDLKSSHQKATRSSTVAPALAETALSIAVAATVVGTAATLLVQRTNKASEEAEASLKKCEACLGSGICPECKGEGFVLKRLSDASAEKARLTAKNMATRYTAGLPKKWSYCTKCSSTRSCLTCGGSGKTSI